MQEAVPLSLPFNVQRAIAIVCILLGISLGRAADPRPVVGPGATKDDVINAYGWPNGQAQSGTKEILSYAQGEVILENGRVERVNFSPDVPWQAPRPRPGAPSKVVEVPVDYWFTNFDEAAREARRRGAWILALFTGSDWSPASRRFHDEVEFHPDFVNAFTGKFVFLRLDYPRGNAVKAAISPENQRLRERYEVTTYPSLLMLSADGALRARVDLETPQSGETYRARVIAAVAAARDQLPASQPVAAPEAPVATENPATPSPASAAPAETPAPATAEPTAPPPGRDAATARAMWSAGRLVALALTLGAGLIVLCWWLLWRRPKVPRTASVLEMGERIDAAADGLPSPAAMVAWPKQKLTAITAGLAEFDGYLIEERAGGDVDLALRKRGDERPRVLVHCSPGSAGLVSTKRVRELFGTLTAEGVAIGWLVSPAGFLADARDYAAAHQVVLISSEGLHNLMREVPPVSLPKLLART